MNNTKYVDELVDKLNTMADGQVYDPNELPILAVYQEALEEAEKRGMLRAAAMLENSYDGIILAGMIKSAAEKINT